MGTGKTQIAKQLAHVLNVQYVSTDEAIESHEGKTISSIFAEEGEAYFRKIEKKIVKEVSEKQDRIIDTGGGVVLDEENMKNLKRGGIVICLWTEPREIHNRTKKHNHRPLLNTDDPVGKIKELLGIRKPFYKKAQFHIDTTNGSMQRAVDKIRKIIENEEKKENNS